MQHVTHDIWLVISEDSDEMTTKFPVILVGFCLPAIFHFLFFFSSSTTSSIPIGIRQENYLNTFDSPFENIID